MSFLQFGAYLTLAVTAFAAALRPSALGKFVRIRRATDLSIRGFFLATAAQQVALALEAESGARIFVTFAQLLALATMLFCVTLDARRAVVRFSNALEAIRSEYDGLALVPGEKGRRMVKDGSAKRLDIGGTVAATINHALYGED